MNQRLYRNVCRHGMEIRHVGEVGVYLPETSNVLGFIRDGVPTDLFEPDPESLARIEAMFGNLPNVKVHPFAIHKDSGKIRLYRAGASTFSADLPSSPALINDRFQPSDAAAFEVEARLFSDFDDGSLDLLSIDIEGCEWYVLMHLVSRPKVLSIETGWKRYTNPFLSEIKEWTSREDYRLWYRDSSDSVFLRRDIPLGMMQRWRDLLGW